ncbi:MAG: GNAT family N-acetyltransferase [Candidatus Latescibacterota bacterium]
MAMGKRVTMIYWGGTSHWLGKILEHPEVMTQGQTIEEFEENLRDAYTMSSRHDMNLNPATRRKQPVPRHAGIDDALGSAPADANTHRLRGTGPRNATVDITVRLALPSDRPWILRLCRRHWGGERIVTRGRCHEVTALPALVALRGGRRAGLLAYREEPGACELVALAVAPRHRGVGTALLAALEERLQTRGCRRLWTITTNDNTDALRFWQRRGFTLSALHREALTRSRLLKPEIPLTGEGGIPLRDEIELEKLLPQRQPCGHA